MTESKALDMFGPPDLSSPSFQWGPYSRGRGTNLPTYNVPNVYEKARQSCSHVSFPLKDSYDYIDSRIFLLGKSLCEGPWTTENPRLIGRSSLNRCEASSIEGHLKKVVKTEFVVPRRALSESPVAHIPPDSSIRKAVGDLHRYAVHPATLSDTVRYGSVRYQLPDL
jgi:hypothetical protein